MEDKIYYFVQALDSGVRFAGEGDVLQREGFIVITFQDWINADRPTALSLVNEQPRYGMSFD